MKQFKITENDANQRLDKFLKKLFPMATRSLLYKFNRTNKIKVNWKREDNEYKLQIWDEVKIFLVDNDFDKLSTEAPKSQINNENRVKLDKKDIVFEDNFLLVVNKPAGINVHPGNHKTKETNLISQVQDYLGDKLNSLTFKPSLAHRIDRDTSGIVIIAKKKDILTRLVEDFKNHKNIRKYYLAVVSGHLDKKEWIIDKKLERIENAQNENKVLVSENGLKAVSHYKVIDEFKYKNEDLSLVEVEIKTGRMHQIRVHMTSIWHPVVWDKTYGNKSLNHYLQKELWVNRQLLHAEKLEFTHYWTWKKMTLEARLKEDMKGFLDKIK